MTAESKTIEYLDTQNLIIYVHDKARDKLIRYDKEGNEIVRETYIGIVGEVFTEKKQRNITNNYKHILFNNQIDIDTQMPVICLPILEKAQQHDTEKVCLGVIQAINSKGVEDVI
jgi:hypothetical protein